MYFRKIYCKREQIYVAYSISTQLLQLFQEKWGKYHMVRKTLRRNGLVLSFVYLPFFVSGDKFSTVVWERGAVRVAEST